MLHVWTFASPSNRNFNGLQRFVAVPLKNLMLDKLLLLRNSPTRKQTRATAVNCQHNIRQSNRSISISISTGLERSNTFQHEPKPLGSCWRTWIWKSWSCSARLSALLAMSCQEQPKHLSKSGTYLLIILQWVEQFSESNLKRCRWLYLDCLDVLPFLFNGQIQSTKNTKNNSILMVASHFKYLNIVQSLVLLEPTSRWKTRSLSHENTIRLERSKLLYVLNLLWINHNQSIHLTTFCFHCANQWQSGNPPWAS